MSFLVAAKTDANQPDIVKALRGAGCTVVSLHRVGDGCADLLVQSPHSRRLHLLEVKAPDWKPQGPRAKRSKTQAAQEAFQRTWPVDIVQTEEQALRAVGAHWWKEKEQP